MFPPLPIPLFFGVLFFIRFYVLRLFLVFSIFRIHLSLVVHACMCIRSSLMRHRASDASLVGFFFFFFGVFILS